MNAKQQLGQFMTTNYDYILSGFTQVPDNTRVIEPFCGQGHLLNFSGVKNVECYDIEPQISGTIERDTILCPPDYKNKYVITNPPYLARNKSSTKSYFDKYNVNDLYKCFIKELITNTPIGGILIIPLNFWSSIRKSDIDLRRQFLSVFNVHRLNIFEERVFEDTSYTVCSFQFSIGVSGKIDTYIYPSQKNIKLALNKSNNYTIGGEIYKLEQSDYVVYRATRINRNKLNSHIRVKCIDDNKNNMIGMSVSDTPYIDETDKLTARSYASLIIEPALSDNDQQQLVIKFNEFLNEYRTRYHSLFLTNYRESSDISRKRISFELVYKIVSHLLRK